MNPQTEEQTKEPKIPEELPNKKNIKEWEKYSLNWEKWYKLNKPKSINPNINI